MADNVRMALTEPERKWGHREGPLRSQLVPAAAKGPRHPQGRSEPASGAGRAAALTGNGAVGGCQAGKRPPVTVKHSNLLTRTAIVWFLFGLIKTPKRRTNDDGRHVEHGTCRIVAQG
jgi:hypothetical protein